ncbi:hypothetical protein MTO96_001190 [Rhipicephalus appendiculatus]
MPTVEEMLQWMLYRLGQGRHEHAQLSMRRSVHTEVQYQRPHMQICHGKVDGVSRQRARVVRGRQSCHCQQRNLYSEEELRGQQHGRSRCTMPTQVDVEGDAKSGLRTVGSGIK